MSDDDRLAVMENIKDNYDARIVALLEKLRALVTAHGWHAAEQFTMHDDDFRWTFACWPGERDANDATTVDFAVEIGEAVAYGDDDQPYGMSFRLDIVAYGGKILGGFAPYNYTPQCWVDGRDFQLVSERWALMEDASLDSVPDLLDAFLAEQTCQWFALCANPATTSIQHPILGSVPTCSRCAAKAAEQ